MKTKEKKNIKLEKQLFNYVKELYDKYPTLNSFSYWIHNFEDQDKFYCCEEQIWINDESWDNIGDEKLYNIVCKIKELRNGLDLETEDKNILSDMTKRYWNKYENSDPLRHLVSTWDNYQQKINEDINTKKNKKVFESFPWKYIDCLAIHTKRNGEVEIEEVDSR